MELIANTKPHLAFQDHKHFVVTIMDVGRRTR